MNKQKILIVDDSEINRALLSDILEDQYDVTEAENGAQAVRILAENETDFYFVLLDIMMPEMDGFDVLNYINKHYWNDRVVVMMISSDDSPENINRAYSLGAFDYIGRPFDPMIVRKRIANTMYLYARQNDLEEAVKEQFDKRQKNNDLMISILSHIVEFRNGESGLHVQHVKAITELLLKELSFLTDKYSLSDEDIALISTASAIHDVGKISIPEEILNKPGRLTEEEFEMIKTHTEIGSKMLSDLPIEQFNSPLAKVAYEICRWHHERYDGGGYPDGLRGEEIPIAAQVVSIADVYDALTSERCYKKAFSHDEALTMILAGECGQFNPMLLTCLEGVSDKLKKAYEDIELGREASRVRHINDKTDAYTGCPDKHEHTHSQPEYMQLLYVDSLTGIYNRRYFKERIQDASYIKAAAFIDLNGLDKINETYGRSAGDQVLQSTAQTVLSLIRKSDHLIRYGGDEFMILFENMAEQSFGVRLGEILHCLDTLTFDGYPMMHISASIGGVYGITEQGEFFKMAIDILNRAKEAENHMAISFLN